MRDLKAEKIREMTEDEILTKIRELKEELFHLRFRNQMRQLQNPLLLREKKRDVARMNTILAEHRSGIRPVAGVGMPAPTPSAAGRGVAPGEAQGAAPAGVSTARPKPKKATKSKPKKAAKTKSRPTASKAKAKAKKPAAKGKAKKS